MSTLIVPAQVPSVADDCEQLQKAFKGWGTNEGLIISILAHRNAAQRKLIRKTYAETYGEDLLKSLEKELTNDFERLVLLWTLDPPERDAFLANEAAKRWTSSNLVLVEIACTRSSHELLLARQAYHTRFKRSLEEDVAYHTTGDFRKVTAIGEHITSRRAQIMSIDFLSLWAGGCGLEAHNNTGMEPLTQVRVLRPSFSSCSTACYLLSFSSITAAVYCS